MRREDCIVDCVGPDCEGCRNYKTRQMTKEITITIIKDDFGHDECYNLFLWCERHKIKTEEPKNSKGLYDKMIIHLDTLEKKVLFQHKYIDKLIQYADIKNQIKMKHKSPYDLNRGGFKNSSHDKRRN